MYDNFSPAAKYPRILYPFLNEKLNMTTFISNRIYQLQLSNALKFKVTQIIKLVMDWICIIQYGRGNKGI